jgi:hypothetical protein
MKSDRRNRRTEPDPKETPRQASARRTETPAARRESIEESLSRKIAAWARFHERCRRGGCRRNARCLEPGNCRVIRDRPPPTDEERLALGRRLREVLNAEMERRLAAGQVPK